MTRQELLALGRGGDAWAFLAPAAHALRVEPGDEAVRFLLGSAFVRLGLFTLAREHLGRLRDEVCALPEVRSMIETCARRADDRVPTDTLIRTCLGNLGALGERGEGLGEAFGSWKDRLPTMDVFRARDGNVVRRWVNRPDELWMMGDHVRAAGCFAQGQLPAIAGGGGPIVVEGIDPPFVLRAILEGTPGDGLGYSARVTIVQRDAMEALDGLSVLDLREHLRSERVRVMVGEDACARLARWGGERLWTQVGGASVTTPGTRERLEPAPGVVVSGLVERQRAWSGVLSARVRERARARGIAHVRERFAGGRGLRVLIPTCRFSTYIRHASADLARALEARGHSARVLIEPDAHTRLSVAAYLSAIDEFDPDLVVLINYPRSAAANGLIPEEIPFVTWFQDAMPHLYDARVGASMGAQDFVVGPIDATMLEDYGYPADRCLALPVVVSEEKFHAGGVSREMRDRFACEMAFVTHHSETPTAMLERLIRESGGDAGMRDRLTRLFESVVALVSRAHEVDLRREIRERTHELFGGSTLDAREGARRVLRSCAIPLADRVYRHQTIEWAAGLAREHGWRLHLYGRGWERHPSLGEFARGEISHGEELRALYGSALVTPHVCATTLLHQRVGECLLSGGLCAWRVMVDHLSGAWARVALARAMSGSAFERVEMEVVREGEQLRVPCREYPIVDDADAMRLASLCDALGVAHRGVLRVGEDRIGGAAVVERLMPRERDPSRMLPMLGEAGFVDRAGLERIVRRAIERPAWRERVIACGARMIREHLTLGSMIERTLAMIGASLHTGARAADGAREDPGAERAHARAA